ncbi:MAG: hypothetical protein IPJ19_02420 [Planctomycetes bacterium]|nr:hypothetical protein [Planctomycetota bacterium]
MTSVLRGLFTAGLILFVWAGISRFERRSDRTDIPRTSAALPEPGHSKSAAHLVERDGRREVLLTTEFRGLCVDVRTDCEVDVREYADLADRLLPRLREWFAPERAPDPLAPRYTLFLCSSVECMLEVERLSGEPPSDFPGRSFAFRGGFYSRSRMVVAENRPTAWMRASLAHELTHAAFFERVGRNADVFDEGLACLLPDWLLETTSGAPQDQDASDERFETRCGTAVGEARPLRLAWLCGLDYWAFRDEQLDGLGFASSWALMKLLVESREPGIGGHMQALFDDLAAGGKPLEALGRQCDRAQLERRWLECMRGWSVWEAAWGSWRDTGNEWTTTLEGWGSHVLVARSRVPDKGFELGFTWHTPPTEGIGLGFVVGLRKGGNLCSIEVREGALRVILCRDGEWQLEQVTRLPDELVLDCQPVSLRCEPDGRASVRIGSEAFALPGLDADEVDGDCGLAVFRQPTAPRRVVAEVEISSPWFEQ